MTKDNQVETINLTEVDLLTKVVQLDLPTLNKLIKIASERRDNLKLKDLKIGAVVKFGRPNGTKRTGIIEKINISKAVIKVNYQKWVVPFSMMEVQNN